VARSAKTGASLDIETVRLAPGSHSSPRDGVCAVELASLLGGEKFSDRPRCVCKVIAGFLRTLNDLVAHAERQELIGYAERAVGSAGSPRVTHMRRDICLLWAGAGLRGSRPTRLLERLAMRVRIGVMVGWRQALRLNEGAGEYAARVAFARHGTAEALALLERLLEVGAEPDAAGSEAAPLAHPVQGSPHPRVAATVRELAGDSQVAQSEDGGQRRDRNGHTRHLGRRHSRKRDKEHVQHDHAGNGDPERETKTAEDLHQPARVP
jgi:hypothetical protein